MGEAHGGGQRHGLFDVLRAVLPSDGREHLRLQRLGIHADAVGSVIQQYLQLLPVNGVRAAGLDAVFHAVRQVEAAVQVGQQRIHLPGGQGGGRAAAHVEGLDAQPRLLHHPSGGGDLLRQRRQIRLHQGEGLLHRRGYEAAIGAAGGAEGDAHVEGYLLRAQVALGAQPGLGALQRQSAAGGRHAVGVPQDAVGLTGGHALLQHAPHQLGRADAGQRAPAGRHAGDIPGGAEEGQLQGALTQAFPLVLVGNACDAHAGFAPRRLAAVCQLRDADSVGLALAERHLRVAVALFALVHRALLREKGQQALLDSVAVVVTAKGQPHRAVPCRM